MRNSPLLRAKNKTERGDRPLASDDVTSNTIRISKEIKPLLKNIQEICSGEGGI